MSISCRLVAGMLVCLASLCAGQSVDEVAAERVLGPHWKQVSRAAGMIFTGTVLRVRKQPPVPSSPIPAIEATLQVDHGIAGVRSGQVIRIRQWASAWPLRVPARGDRRALFFFYSPGSAGLTSLVGGPEGQVSIDIHGNLLNGRTTAALDRMRPPRSPRAVQPAPRPVSIAQLERAIRAAREGKD